MRVHVWHVNDSVFRDESNESHFKFSRNHLHVAGKQDESGQGAVHHVCGGVAQNAICTCLLLIA